MRLPDAFNLAEELFQIVLKEDYTDNPLHSFLDNLFHIIFYWTV